jgi:hypothetical protein
MKRSIARLFFTLYEHTIIFQYSYKCAYKTPVFVKLNVHDKHLINTKMQEKVQNEPAVE